MTQRIPKLPPFRTPPGGKGDSNKGVDKEKYDKGFEEAFGATRKTGTTGTYVYRNGKAIPK